MTENWEIIADTPEKRKKKCANKYCRIYCDFTNQFTCTKCLKIFCIKCRLYESHSCEVEKRERDEKQHSPRILYDDLMTLEEIHKKSKNSFQSSS